jgi:hypothetical protein
VVWHAACPEARRGGEKRTWSGGGRTAILGILLAVGVWSLVAGRSLWFDELFALHAASLSPWELLRFVRDHDAHPPCTTPC